MENECKALNKRFLTFHKEHRPYIILKWAQTANKKIASPNKRLHISNDFTNRLVHKWRSEEAAILVGTNTALIDDPELNNRLWSGSNPVRLIADMHLRLPHSLKIFNSNQPTIIFNSIQHAEDKNPGYYQVTEDISLVHQMLNACYQKNIQSILVEGGSILLQSFINEGMWDEARIITNTNMYIEEGLNAPHLANDHLLHSENIFADRVDYFYHHNNQYIHE